MPLDTSIPARALVNLPDPLEQYGRALTLRNLMLDSEARANASNRANERAAYDRQFWSQPAPAAEPAAPRVRLSDLMASMTGTQAPPPEPVAPRDPMMSRLGDYAAGLAQRGYVGEALKAREAFDGWNAGQAEREAFGRYSDPVRKDRADFLREVGRTDPRRAMEWAKDLADFDKALFGADREGLKLAGEKIGEMGQVLASAVDQPSWERALAWADSLGLDRSSLPAQFDPALVQQARRYQMTAAQQLAEVWRQRRYDQTQANIDADNARADASLSLSRTRERRVAAGKPPAAKAPTEAGIRGRILAKVAAGEPLTEAEQRAYEMSRSRGGRARDGQTSGGRSQPPASAPGQRRVANPFEGGARTYERTATNPRTGERMGWDGSKWVPIK